MKYLVQFILLLFSSNLFATESLDLVGSWQYTEYIYQGQTNPLPNPDLVLILEFGIDGTETLFWTRKDQPGFCEAKAVFQVINNYLLSEIYWTNPKNNPDCGQDPDMQIGRRTISPVETKGNKMYLNIGLAGEPFYYVFTKVE